MAIIPVGLSSCTFYDTLFYAISDKLYAEAVGVGAESEMYIDEIGLPEPPPEIQVDLDAEYFRWKESSKGAGASGKRERRSFFSKK